MGAWDRFSEWLSALVVTSLVWLTGAFATDAPTSDLAQFAQATQARALKLGWAQDDGAPPIEQVGEGQSGDIETLDEGATEGDSQPAEDVEPQDTAGAEEDIELLDQGAPPAAASATTEPAPPVDTTYEAPPADTGAVDSSGYVAPVATGPALPEGFGTGRVHVAAGQAGFPEGLAECHVGAVTGRAYVGVDCGNGDSFVGFAPSFEDFPFVVDENFPFGEEGAPGAEAEETSLGDDIEVRAASGGAGPDGEDEIATGTIFESPSNTSVQYAQRARDREARVRVEGKETGGKSSQKASKDDDEEVDTNDSDSDDDYVSAEQKSKKAKHKKSTKGKKRHHDKKDRRKSDRKKN